MKTRAASTRKARSKGSKQPAEGGKRPAAAGGKPETKKPKPKAGPKPAPVQGEVMPVPPGEIMPSPFQTRPPETEAELQGLADSIRASGMLNPLTVRKAGADAPSGVRWELVCGHRRLAAARMAGLLLVPCVALDLDDGAAQIANVVENLQRKDLSPVDEADGVAALTGGGKTAPEIARLLGVSERWVFRRRRLSALLPAWRKTIREKKAGQVFCERLAALPRPMQRLLLNTDLAKNPDPDDIGEALWEAGARDLEKMPWAERHPEWCGDCANAVNNLDGEGEGIGGTYALRDCRFCGNPACLTEKTAAWVKERWEFLKNAVPPSCPTPVKVKQECFAPWPRSDKDDRKFCWAHLVTDGSGAGKIVWCQAPKPEKAGASDAGREERKEIPGRREEYGRISATHRLIADGGGTDPADMRLALILTLLYHSDWNEGMTRMERVTAAMALPDAGLAAAVARQVRRWFPQWMDQTRFITERNHKEGAREEAVWLADKFGITEKDIAGQTAKQDGKKE